MSGDGARTKRLVTANAAADAAVWGTAGELALFLYGRIPLESLKFDGDRRHFDRRFAWEPE